MAWALTRKIRKVVSTDSAEIIEGQGGAPDTAIATACGLAIRTDGGATTTFYQTVNYGVAWSAIGPYTSDYGAGGCATDVIAESTAAAGVTIDGMLVKDKGIDVSALLTGEPYLKLPTNKADAFSIYDSAADILVINTTTGTPVVTITPITTITGYLTLTAGAKTDTVLERTGAAGVTIDSVKCKDGEVYSDRFVTAVIVVPNTGGGGTAALSTVDLYQVDGTTAISTAKEGMILSYPADYNGPTATPTATVTFSLATAGSIIDSGNGWCIFKTDATGNFNCTISDSADETVYFHVCSSPQVDALAQACVVMGCVPDAATWSA